MVWRTKWRMPTENFSGFKHCKNMPMKNIFVIALVDMSLFVQVGLADEKLETYTQKKLSVQKQGGEHSQLRTFATAGMVKKIDPVNGIVTILLDPVQALKWPSMIRILVSATGLCLSVSKLARS